MRKWKVAEPECDGLIECIELIISFHGLALELQSRQTHHHYVVRMRKELLLGAVQFGFDVLHLQILDLLVARSLHLSFFIIYSVFNF